jgi:hypothetical protein
MFRLPVTSRDGIPYAVTLQVDTHRKNPARLRSTISLIV